MTPAALLVLYDDTMRKNAHVAGCVREQTDTVSRYTTSTGSMRYIMWQDCAPADAARVVDEELRATKGRAKVLMWKLYAHGAAPAALRAALLDRGFAEHDHCTLMMVPVDMLVQTLAASCKHETRLQVRQLTTVKDLDAYQSIWDDVWPDAPNARYVDDYRVRVEQNDGGVVFFAGFADDHEPVSAGYLFHHPGHPIGLLCGGSTKVAWRRQHAYTSMLAARAGCALERGAAYLAVEASPESKRILERLGFAPLSTLAFYEINVGTP